MSGIYVFPVRTVPEVARGDDIAALLLTAIEGDQEIESLRDGDVVVVTQKVVSKAEGRLVADHQKDAAIAAESVRTLRRMTTSVIAETAHGFVCANAGIDSSNVPAGFVALLPRDPDASARQLRARLEHAAGVRLAVVISDTFGRPWRLGQTDVAIGVAGMHAFADYRGAKDAQGRELAVTRICVADEVAGAAELVMGKATGICAAIVRGAATKAGRGSAGSIVRPPGEDLFR